MMTLLTLPDEPVPPSKAELLPLDDVVPVPVPDQDVTLEPPPEIVPWDTTAYDEAVAYFESILDN
jgi:hypothetical protein